MNNQDKVIERIKKLLLRTEENGCTPGEAASAAAQVAMLLAKHNLKLDEISAEEMQLVKEEFIKDTKSCSVYQSEISAVLEKHFGVSTFIRTRYTSNARRVSTLAVYGESIKVQAFIQTFEFVYRAYKSCWTAYHKTLQVSMQEKNAMRLSYLHGFLDGVTNEIIKEENANALVVSKSQSVRDFELTLRGVHKFSVHAVHNSMANEKGYSDGTYAQQNRNKAIV